MKSSSLYSTSTNDFKLPTSWIRWFFFYALIFCCMQFVFYNDPCFLRGIPLTFLFVYVSFFVCFFPRMFLVTSKNLFTCYLSPVICAKRTSNIENERKHVWYKYCCSVFELSRVLEATVVSKHHFVSELSVQFFREVWLYGYLTCKYIYWMLIIIISVLYT